jgi:polysaccharide transporter, PST family
VKIESEKKTRGITKNLRALLGSRLSKNIISMYFVQGARYLIPLITIPYLARVLGVSSWGSLAFTQAFSLYLCLIVDYGFELSATREIAENLGNKKKLADTLANVLSVKICLSFIIILAASIMQRYFGSFFVSPILFRAGIFWALSNTFNLFWFFQGVERVHLLAGLDVMSKIIGIAMILFLVESPGDEWIVLAVYGGSSTVVFFISLYLAIDRVGFGIPSISSSISMLKYGWNTFVIRLFSSIYASSSPFILGLLVTPELVGPYSAAEKVARTAKEMMRPITRTLYPRFSVLLKNDPSQAQLQIRQTLFWLSILGAILTGIVYWFSGHIIGLLFGPGYEAAIPILKIMSFVIFLSTVSNVLGIQWLLPNGFDRKVSVLTLMTFAIFIIATLILVPASGGLGMAVSILVAEFSMIAMCLIALKQHNLIIFSTARDSESID